MIAIIFLSDTHRDVQKVFSHCNVLLSIVNTQFYKDFYVCSHCRVAMLTDMNNCIVLYDIFILYSYNMWKSSTISMKAHFTTNEIMIKLRIKVVIHSYCHESES